MIYAHGGNLNMWECYTKLIARSNERKEKECRV